MQLLRMVEKWVGKTEAPRAPRTSLSSAPKVPKSDATEEGKKRRKRAKGLMRSSLNQSRRTAWRKLAAASLWMQTCSTTTWNSPLHIRCSTIPVWYVYESQWLYPTYASAVSAPIYRPLQAEHFPIIVALGTFIKENNCNCKKFIKFNRKIKKSSTWFSGWG